MNKEEAIDEKFGNMNLLSSDINEETISDAYQQEIYER